MSEQSIYAFERTELRVLMLKCNGDPELFINRVAGIIGELTVERDRHKRRAEMAEHRIRELEQ